VLVAWHGARLRGRRGCGHLEPGPQLHLPLVQGLPATGKDEVAMTEGHRTPELVISLREVTRGCANLAVGQLSGGQPVSHLDRKRSQAHRLIMPYQGCSARPIAQEVVSGHSPPATSQVRLCLVGLLVPVNDRRGEPVLHGSGTNQTPHCQLGNLTGTCRQAA
jgi:hypothetical protein